jgi:2-phosphosulfolactate phosphatase
MRIELFLTPGELPDFHTKGRRIFLVDVLRAGTSLAVALEAGAERIVPAESVEGAKQLLSLLDRKTTLLAGEKDGSKVPGFDLGNSPAEFRDPGVAGRTIVFTSDNAAPLMARMYDEVDKPLVSFVNVSAAASYLNAGSDEEVTILCAGQGGQFSLEDAVCGGMLCAKILENAGYSRETASPEWWMRSDSESTPGGTGRENVLLSDGARAALHLYHTHRDAIAPLIRSASGGRRLRELALGGDLDEASRVDSLSVVPVIREGRVVLARTSSTEV